MIYRPKLSFRDIIDYLRTSKARVTAAPVRVHRISQQQAVLDNTVPSWGRPKSVIWGRVTLPTPMPKFEWNARTNRFPSYAQRRIDIRKREEREREKLSTNLAARLHISRLYSSDRTNEHRLSPASTFHVFPGSPSVFSLSPSGPQKLSHQLFLVNGTHCK